MNDDAGPIVTMYRPVSTDELKFIEDSGFREFPAPAPPARFLYVMNNEGYAHRTAVGWTLPRSGGAAVVRFQLHGDYVTGHPERVLRNGGITVLWVPVAEVDDFNMHIIGDIEVLSHHGIGEKN